MLGEQPRNAATIHAGYGLVAGYFWFRKKERIKTYPFAMQSGERETLGWSWVRSFDTRTDTSR